MQRLWVAVALLFVVRLQPLAARRLRGVAFSPPGSQQPAEPLYKTAAARCRAPGPGDSLPIPDLQLLASWPSSDRPSNVTVVTQLNLERWAWKTTCCS